MEGQYPDWWRKKGNATVSRSLSSNQPPKIPITTPKPLANGAVVPATPLTSSNTGDSGNFYAFIMNASTPAPALTTYIDSAASDHFFCQC